MPKTNAQTQDLADRTADNCGFYLFFHSSHASEYNDTETDGFNYIRAAHNFRRPIKSIGDENTWRVEKLCGNMHTYEGQYDLGNPHNGKDVAYHSLLPKIKRTISKEPRKERREGILGVLGFTKTVMVDGRTQFECDGESPLCQEILTDRKDPAYTTGLTFKSNATDGMGRPTPPGTVSVVGTQEDARIVFEYLQEHPDQYLSFIKALIPEQKFPNVNKYILSKAFPRDSIVFLDVPKGIKREFVKKTEGEQ